MTAERSWSKETTSPSNRTPRNDEYTNYPHTRKLGEDAKYSRLISWTEADLANCLLTEILELFADSSSGALEGFLGRIYYADRVSAERVLEQVTEIVRTQHGGKLPMSYHGEVREHPDGRFL